MFTQLSLQGKGRFPNSPHLPLLHYRRAVDLSGSEDPAAVFERLFHENGWSGSWRDGVYDFHHYHSTAHEVLGVYSGSATVQMGGEAADGGQPVEIRAGDVVVIPAGVAHRRLQASPDFAVVGSYPGGQSPDLCRGIPGERPGSDRRIAAVTLPAADPVEGPQGALTKLWGQAV